MSEPRKPLPRWVVYLVAVLMWPYFVLLGLRELWRRLARLGRDGR